MNEDYNLALLLNFKKYQPANEDYLRIWQAIDQGVERIEEKNSDAKIIAIHHRKSTTPNPGSLVFHSRKLVASLLVGILLLSVIVWFFFLRGPHKNYLTGYGEIKTIVLPDNSIVKLNANSSLSLINDWTGDKPREVWLEGEAFFSVMHKANNRKFLVHVDDLRVEVLGTEFNVSNRREKARVVLNSGKVKLDYEGKEDNHESGQSIFMEPGDMVGLVENTNQNKKFIKKRVDPELATSWRNNQLIFKDTPIKEVVNTIQDHFGIEVILQDIALANYHYTGTIPLDNINIFFATISKSFNVNIMKNKHQILIQKRRGDPDP